MKKRYYVAIWTKRGFYRIRTNSLRFATMIMKSNLFRIVKITDQKAYEIVGYKNKDLG